MISLHMQKTKHVLAEYLNHLDRLSVKNNFLSDKMCLNRFVYYFPFDFHEWIVEACVNPS